MTIKDNYLFNKTKEQQKEFLNDCIKKINNNVKSKVIEVIGKDKANKNERALTTDTHGDLISLMGAAVMCGVKFKENEFLYYDRNEGIYYEKIDDKYYKYTPPYTGPKKEGGSIDKISDNNITIIPIPDTSNARDLYHLGDVLDRGKESLTSLLLCEVCPNIKLAQGNHEFMSAKCSKENGAYEVELKSIHKTLARMKLNNRIVIGFYDGSGNDVISYSHIPLTEDRIVGFFDFLSAVYIEEKYKKGEPTVMEALNKEFKEQGQEELLNKILNKDINNNYDEDYYDDEDHYDDYNDKNIKFKEIKNNFTKEEMLIIKNIIGDALIKRRFKIAENDKITFVNGGFMENFYEDFNELDGQEGNIVNFARGDEDKTICPTVKGHDYGCNEIKVIGNCLDIDDLKSVGYRGNKGYKEYFKEQYNYNLKNESCATVTNLNIGTGIVTNYSFTVARLEDNSIADKFEQNTEGHETITLENFALLEKTKINNIIDNVENEEMEENKTAIINGNLQEKNVDLNTNNIKAKFAEAYENENFEDIERLLNFCIDEISIPRPEKNFFKDFLEISELICNNNDKFSKLTEKFIKNISERDNKVIIKIFSAAYTNNNSELIDKLLNNIDIKYKINDENINKHLLISNAFNNNNINMAKILIKHDFKFNFKKTTEIEKKSLKIIKDSIKNLANNYNISKKKLNNIISKNKKNSIEEEFNRLNEVLDLIKKQIEIESNFQTESNYKTK